jgi:hypothetical protein
MAYTRKKSPSRKEFLTKAQLQHHAFVDQGYTAIPQKVGAAIVMRPAVVLRYTVNEPQAGGAIEYVFNETLVADAAGEVYFTPSLLTTLKAAGVTIQGTRDGNGF